MKRCMVILLTLVPASVVAAPLMKTLEELHRQRFEESLNYKITCEDPRQKAILEQVRKKQVTFAAGFEAWRKLIVPLRFSPQEPFDFTIGDDDSWLGMSAHYLSILKHWEPNLPRHP